MHDQLSKLRHTIVIELAHGDLENRSNLTEPWERSTGVLQLGGDILYYSDQRSSSEYVAPAVFFSSGAWHTSVPPLDSTPNDWPAVRAPSLSSVNFHDSVAQPSPAFHHTGPEDLHLF